MHLAEMAKCTECDSSDRIIRCPNRPTMDIHGGSFCIYFDNEHLVL